MKRLTSILFIPIILFMSCSEDDGNINQGTQPELPPQSSMAPDFSNFSNNENARVEATENWIYAAANVGIYSAILYANLVVPVSAFQLAVDQTPTFNSDANLWIWTYNADIPNKGNYNVRLTASVDSQEVDWTGYISLDGSFEDFVWFEGKSNLSADAGSWVLYESPNTPTEWLSVQWTKNDSEGAANSSFTIEKEGDYKNSSISYSAESNATLDRSVTIVDTKNSNTIETSWRSTTSEGRVKSQLKYGDELFHCWDGSLSDTACD
jgi:hypothetical protein